MSNTAIKTAQNVNINLSIASLGHRLLAFLIDGLLLFVYLVFLEYIDLGVSEFTNRNTRWGIQSILMLPVAFYSLFFNIIFNGRTPGKFIMNMKVVKKDGSPATWTDYAIRWVLRLVDIWLVNGSIGVVAIIFSDNNQRLGDAAANTIVIDTRKKTKVSHTILEEVEAEYIPTFSMVHSLNDHQVNEIKEIYRLAGESRDYQTLKELRTKIEEILMIRSEMKDAPFVRTILKDYSYYTQRT